MAEQSDSAAPSFEREPYPATYGRPDRSGLKRALRAYVMGHDQGRSAARKLAEAEAEVEPGPTDRFRQPSAGKDVQELEEMSAELPRAGTLQSPEAPIRQARFGVPVPDRLVFHRGPDVWRDRIGRPQVRSSGDEG